jgi:hypothetical protein
MTKKLYIGVLIVAATMTCGVTSVRAQSTAWTYQGRLNTSTGVANGNYDLQFAVFNAVTSGAQQGPTLTNTPVGVTNGLFTVNLDFGAGVFTGPDRWLEIGVRSNGQAVAFTILAARQRLTPSPYALFAPNAATAATANGLAAGTVSASQLNTPGGPGAGQVLAYNGSGLVWTNASTAAAGWLLNGNMGTTAGANFLGTADNQPLELKANSLRALSLEPNANGAPNVIGGGPNNYVQPGIVGGTIGGGGATNYNTGVLGIPLNGSNSLRSSFAVVGGGLANSIQSNSIYTVINGGLGNSIGVNSSEGVIGGGYQNVIASNSIATVLGGGDQNGIDSSSPFSTIGGGGVNYILRNSGSATIAGGEGNQISTNGDHAFIGGGRGNFIQTNSASTTISGGSNNVALGAVATIGGGGANQIGADYATIAGGLMNSNQSRWSVIGGGSLNRITGDYFGTIGGGDANQITFDYGTIGGGLLNTNSGSVATIGGGQQNTASGGASTIPGGSQNTASGDYSFAAGWQAQALHFGSFVWADGIGTPFSSSGPFQFLIRAGGGVGINTNNPGGAGLAVVGGIRNGPGGTIQNRVLFGTANVGTGTNGVNTFTITFPTTFANTPKVFVMAKGNDNPDTFAISTRAVTTSNFKVNIVRVDLASGWGQSLNVDWYATE